MAGSSKTIHQAKEALKRLILTPRPGPEGHPGETFHFGIVPQGYFEGNRDWPVEEHRSIALVTAAILDQALQGAILSRFPGLKAGNEAYLFHSDAAPLRDLDAKIRVAFALGLIGEGARSDLSLLRQIRDTFAHSRLDISFNTPEIAEACTHFTLPKRKPNFVSIENPSQTFIDVGWEYAINLIVLEQDRGTPDRHAAEMLDLPLPPLPETP